MRRALAIMALAALTACGSDTTSTAGFSALRNLAGGLLDRGDAKPSPVLTRADIRAVGAPLIRVEVLDSDITAYFGVLRARGDVVTWSTVARESVTLKAGQLIQTRGLGADLLSGIAPDLNQLLTGQTVTRRYYNLDGADGTVESVVTCTPRVIGKERIEIVGLAYDTARVDEVCTGESLNFTNIFWIDSGAKLRQSVQWVSPILGQVRISDLQE